MSKKLESKLHTAKLTMKSEKKCVTHVCYEIIACFIDSRFPPTYNCMNGTFILFTFEIFFNFCIQKFSLGKLRTYGQY